MKILFILLIFTPGAFANNALIESKDINVLSERDEVIDQGITSGEEIKASILNKKIDALNLKQEQFKPEVFTNLTNQSENLTTNTGYSTTTATILTIEKKYDSADTYLQVDLNYFLRLYAPSTGNHACSVEVLFNGVSCGIFQTLYKNLRDNSIQIHSINAQCLSLDKGTYNVSLKRYRGTRGGAYTAGNCYFFTHGWGNQSLRVVEEIR